MSDTETTSIAPPKNGVSIVRILALLGIAAAIFGVGAGAMWFVNQKNDVMVTARGKITWNGQPVSIGAIMSEHQGNQTICPIGPLQEDGTFELLTNMQPGVPVGRYKLKVASFANGMPPVPLVPTVYTDYSTSPLFIEVTSNAETNVFELVLEGELAESRRGGRRPDADADATPTEDEAGDSPAVAAEADTEQTETPAATTDPN